MTPERTRVVFMGSPSFAVPVLDALVAAGYDVVAVVSQPDRPAGRGERVTAPPVKARAARLGCAVIQPETLKDASVQEDLAGLRADVFVVAAYGKILPRAVLALPRRGSLNVHASLLPRWRGASPVAAAILAGDAETGVTIMEVVPRMDAGPVVARRSTSILERESTGALEARLSALGAELLVETLPGWLDGTIGPVAQDESLATYCRTLAKDAGLLRNDMTAEDAERAVRAFDPWPGAFVTYRGERLAVWAARTVPGSGPPGTLTLLGNEPQIAFHQGFLVLEKVQRPGGRVITGREFVNGQSGRLEPLVGLG